MPLTIVRPGCPHRSTMTGRISPSLRRLGDGPHLKQRGGPDHIRWCWSLYGIFGKPADMHTDGHAATLDEAKAQLETAWHRWLAWARDSVGIISKLAAARRWWWPVLVTTVALPPPTVH